MLPPKTPARFASLFTGGLPAQHEIRQYERGACGVRGTARALLDGGTHLGDRDFLEQQELIVRFARLAQVGGAAAFSITAEDDDGGRSSQDVVVTIGTNTPPPLPDLMYPDGKTVVGTVQPIILLENVSDPDGDAVQYFIELDYDPCFCSLEVQRSGPLVQGELATEWPLPRALNVDEATMGHSRFYVRRWTSDGLSESEKGVALFDVNIAPNSPQDTIETSDEIRASSTAGCACRAGGPTSERIGATGVLTVAALTVGWRARRRSRRPEQGHH